MLGSRSCVTSFIIAALGLFLLSAAKADPITIYTINQLDSIGIDPLMPLSGSYMLGADISASGFSFAPIGSYSKPFTGTLDGGNHTINSLSILSGTGISIGVFGDIGATALVKNIGLTNIIYTVNSIGGVNVGGIAAQSSGAISNSYVTGLIKITGNDPPFGSSVGGLIGRGDSTSVIDKSYASIAIANTTDPGIGVDTGGLAGFNGGRISQSYSAGIVTGPSDGLWVQRTGGLLGINSGSIAQSFSTATVNGNYETGGLVGNNFGGSITESYAKGDVNGGSGAGGPIDINPPFGPYQPATGGLIEMAMGGGSVSQVYATGNVTASSSVATGALIGATGLTGPTITAGYTASQLQPGTLPPGFDPSVWSAVAGQYPTLNGVGGQSAHDQFVNSFNSLGRVDGIW
jgi:hypothetical protein